VKKCFHTANLKWSLASEIGCNLDLNKKEKPNLENLFREIFQLKTTSQNAKCTMGSSKRRNQVT
jgi:hypothetical protein